MSKIRTKRIEYYWIIYIINFNYRPNKNNCFLFECVNFVLDDSTQLKYLYNENLIIDKNIFKDAIFI